MQLSVVVLALAAQAAAFPVFNLFGKRALKPSGSSLANDTSSSIGNSSDSLTSSVWWPANSTVSANLTSTMFWPTDPTHSADLTSTMFWPAESSRSFASVTTLDSLPTTTDIG